ncbi:MAG: hypothetical protein QF893_12250 [Alphaproteobacteria bacterium]|jgi:hypothetical protein|nr:hypothetical protein [Alphaproteobacteria bacterium]
MTSNLAELVAFHLTGQRPGHEAGDIQAIGLRPALLAAYGDLAALRYDYPVVLVEDGAGASELRALTAIVDGLASELAPQGAEGEQTRRQLLRLEAEIRGLSVAGAAGSLTELWTRARDALLDDADDSDGEDLAGTLDRAATLLTVDGAVVDCGLEAPKRLLRHAWSRAEQAKGHRFQDRREALCRALDDILGADAAKSEAGRTPDKLRHAMGTAYQNVFDFEAMSKLLKEASHETPLPKSREARIRWALAELTAQRFYAAGDVAEAEPPYDFAFESLDEALAAFHERLPDAVRLLKAISIAELEVENRYEDARHDPYFEGFDEASLQVEDLAMFPTYLVHLADGDVVARAKALEALGSGLPLKVVVQIDDILAESAVETGQFAFGAKSLQLATAAIGLHNAFVLQSAVSNLYQLRESIGDGMRYPGPALFSVYSAAGAESDGLPPYLMAAAAMESRAFPAFTYDPSAGADWAARFHVADNPEATADWPQRTLAYEDADLQTVRETAPFTFVDFVAADRRYRAHFAALPFAETPEEAVPAGNYLDRSAEADGSALPTVTTVDDDNRLHRLIVDESVIRAARRCLEMWRSLQELGGIHNSHARRLLEKERQLWEAEKEAELAALRAELAAAPPQTTAPVAAPTAALPAAEAAPEVEAEPVAEEAPSADELWIETARCTTCNECTEINGVIFAYDDNRQAYVADPDGGPFADIVAAAENCQVSIIHPGKPRNPNETNLEELVQRAAPFI